MDPDLVCSVKALAALSALALLLVAERLAPASRAGVGTLRHDVRNLTLGLVNAALGVAVSAWLLPLVARPGHGLLALLDLSGALSWILALLALDLWMFAWHRMSHGVPLLWRVHRMHHADPSMDASTALRFHPIESVLSALLRLPLAWALGLSLEHIVVYEAVMLPVILLHHSNLRVPRWLDAALRWVIVTPGLHRTHHSPIPQETDSNFGSVLTLWDRLARTLRPAPLAAEPRFGLADTDGPRWQSLSGMLATPFLPPPRAQGPEVVPRLSGRR